jgi:hypothetical protein
VASRSREKTPFPFVGKTPGANPSTKKNPFNKSHEEIKHGTYCVPFSYVHYTSFSTYCNNNVSALLGALSVRLGRR